MKKAILLFAVKIFLPAVLQNAAAQPCGERKLDPRVAGFLRLTGYRDITLEQYRSMPMQALKFPPLPLQPYPREDVTRMKITADSIPVLVSIRCMQLIFRSLSTIMAEVLSHPWFRAWNILYGGMQKHLTLLLLRLITA